MNFNPIASCNKCLKNVEAYQWFKPKNKSKKKIHVEGDYGKYRTQYLYKCPDCNEVVEPYFYAAFNVIDWSKPGTRIGDRKRPLSPNTIRRCEYGVDKYWDEPSFINVKFSSGVDFRVKSASDSPLTAQPCDASIGILNPQIISSRYIQGIGNRVRESAQSPLPVQVTDGRESVMFPPLVIDGGWSDSKRVDVADKDPMSTQDTGQTKGLVLPFLIKNYGGEPQKPVKGTDPLGAVTAQDHHGLLNMPLIVENHGTSKARPAIDRLPGIQTNAKHGIIMKDKFNSFLSYHYGGSQASHITDRISLVKEPYEKPKLEDCFYRMLLPHEIQLGMAFAENYIVLGNPKEKVKQLGNAVTPPVMKFLISRCVASLQ